MSQPTSTRADDIIAALSQLNITPEATTSISQGYDPTAIDEITRYNNWLSHIPSLRYVATINPLNLTLAGIYAINDVNIINAVCEKAFLIRKSRIDVNLQVQAWSSEEVEAYVELHDQRHRVGGAFETTMHWRACVEMEQERVRQAALDLAQEIEGLKL